jgi:hypothetical protein
VKGFDHHNVVDQIGHVVHGFYQVEVEPPGHFGKECGVFPYESSAGDHKVVEIVGCGESREQQRIKGDECNDEKEQVKNRSVAYVELVVHGEKIIQF